MNADFTIRYKHRVFEPGGLSSQLHSRRLLYDAVPKARNELWVHSSSYKPDSVGFSPAASVGRPYWSLLLWEEWTSNLKLRISATVVEVPESPRV